MRTLLGLTILIACTSASPPGDGYETRTIEGWTVLVARPLLDEQAAVGRDALRLLEVKLYDVTRVVPSKACAELRKVPIYLCVQEGTKGAGGAEYHPSAEWLKKNGYNPDKAKAVEIGDAARFLRFSIPQPAVLLHELSHAYHDRVLGFDHPGIKAAYAAAVEGKKYESVLHISGSKKRHYALYPFVRAELKEVDPQICTVLGEVWGP
jgi:hypothetical protein